MSESQAVHVEVVVSRECRLGAEEVRALAEREVRGAALLSPGEWVSGGGGLQLCLCDVEHTRELRPGAAPLRLYAHRLAAGEAALEAGEEGAALLEVLPLPHEALHAQWEALVFGGQLKAEVLRFLSLGALLASRGLGPAAGRSLLLHGPPGTGKTSLCRALAHKLAVRLVPHYPRACLVEVNAHSLFSKWFSESGKIVARIFDRINEIADDPKMLVIILIDEVESVAGSRSAGGGEPSDAVRAVNSVLLALDRARRRPNVLALTTTNQPAGLDAAFRDRADLSRLVAPPRAPQAYRLLRRAAAELQRAGALRPGAGLFPWRVLAASGAPGPAAHCSRRLAALAAAAARGRLSGRALARLPFAALALYCPGALAAPPALAELLAGLARALADTLRDQRDLARDHLADHCDHSDQTPTHQQLLEDIADDQLQALFINGTT